VAKHGKKYLEARARVDRDREYDPADAIRLVKEIKSSKGDETLEVHFRTGLNVRHADEQLRGTIALPHGLGKDVKIAVFARGDKAKEAEEAGADYVGAEDLATKISDEGFTDFDIAIATPDMMPVVGRLGRILGPSGKMPKPEGRHGDDGRRQGRRGIEVRQGRLPHSPPVSRTSSPVSGASWRRWPSGGWAGATHLRLLRPPPRRRRPLRRLTRRAPTRPPTTPHLEPPRPDRRGRRG
jgi:hypothetical protein